VPLTSSARQVYLNKRTRRAGGWYCRGRNEDYSSPPAQIPACAANALGSSLGSNVGSTHGMNPYALRRTAANRIDVATRLSVRATAAGRLFPLGEALPSTTSARRCLPLFGRFLGTTASSDFSSAYMLGVRLSPSRAGPTQVRADETSQVPHKELLHVREVSDCARFFPCKPFAMRRCCLLFLRTRSAPRNLTRFAAQYLARGLPCERFTAALANRTSCITRGRGGWLDLPRGGLAPPILCQLPGALRVGP
jgi:hypothetical protein